MKIETKTPQEKPRRLADCNTLGEVCDFIKSNYDNGQPMSSAGKSLLAAYLKNAKPAK